MFVAVGGEAALVAGGGWKKSGVLLSILQCTGQPPLIKNHPVPNVQNSFKVEKSLEKLCFDT